MGQRLRPNMSQVEVDQLCNETVGMLAYNAWINQPVRKPEQVERFLALAAEERAKWKHVELEVSIEALGSAPVAIIESVAKGIAQSNLAAQSKGEKKCYCHACLWGGTVITSFMIIQARQEEQLKQEVEDTKLN